MPVRRIIISRTARQELRDIWTYLATAAGPTIADRILAEIYDALQDLSDMPGMGHTRVEASDLRYRFWSVRSYIIAYRYTARMLHVARILHGRRDFRGLFP
jgi:toxin ParE1/3/4